MPQVDMVNEPPRILIYGTFAPQNFEFCWLEWLKDHHYPVQAFDHSAILNQYIPSILLRRIMWRFYVNVLTSAVSRQFIKAACSFRPNLVLVVSGNLISPMALNTIRQKTKAILFHFYGEDFFNPLNTKPVLRRAAPYYDHFFTTKSFNIAELAAIGITRTTYLPHGYRPNCHYPVEVSELENKYYGADVSFIGTWEQDRAEVLTNLLEFDLRVWGNMWEKLPGNSRLRERVQGRAVVCEEMSKVINASRINLAFLRKANRDRHTSRTFEIPACGGFELSERTDEVLSFFDEGKEIECFSSVDELSNKIKYYLEHEAQRIQIAKAGLQRVKDSAYSYNDRLLTLLDHYQMVA